LKIKKVKESNEDKIEIKIKGKRKERKKNYQNQIEILFFIHATFI
jgi:hypothetical protein